jgi:ketopantoate reductase
MKIAVIGSGAMGGALAAEAAGAGHEVHVLDVSLDLVAAIRERGIVVSVDGAELTGHVQASTDSTAALTSLPAGDLAQGAAMHELVDATAREACAVAKGLGLAIDTAERLETIQAVLAAAGPGKASMLQDTEARRKTEIEVINGAVVRVAAELGIDAPVNRALAALISGLERSWSL